MENDLARRFAEMSDDELRNYSASAQLDENALALLTAELSRRGLLLHGPSAVIDPGSEAGAARPRYRMLLRGLTPVNAQILLGRLQVEGVDAHLSGAQIAQVQPLWFYALGGVRVFVRREHLAAACDVLNATWKGDYTVPEEEEAAVGADRLNDKRVLGWRIVLWVALVIGGVSLVALWWPSYQQFLHPRTPAPRIDILGRAMASGFLMVSAVLWLIFVECAIRRQERP